MCSTARLESGPELRFNIMDAARELANPLSKDQHPLRLKASSEDLKGVLLIDNLNGTYREPDFDFSLIRFWLVLKGEGLKLATRRQAAARGRASDRDRRALVVASACLRASVLLPRSPFFR